MKAQVYYKNRILYLVLAIMCLAWIQPVFADYPAESHNKPTFYHQPTLTPSSDHRESIYERKIRECEPNPYYLPLITIQYKDGAVWGTVSLVDRTTKRKVQDGSVAIWVEYEIRGWKDGCCKNPIELLYAQDGSNPLQNLPEGKLYFSEEIAQYKDPFLMAIFVKFDKWIQFEGEYFRCWTGMKDRIIRFHKVLPGQSLGLLAQAYQVTVKDIKTWNKQMYPSINLGIQPDWILMVSDGTWHKNAKWELLNK